MGSCISKCRPKRSQYTPKEVVQDKLVIAQQNPKTNSQITFPIANQHKPIPLLKIPPSPSHSTSSSSVSSLVTCTTSKASISSSSSSISSSASLALSSKDKSSFSNEFLWSCYKENPHIVRINSSETSATKPPHMSTTKQSFPQKRVRSHSPNNNSPLTRQKSFRRDQHAHDYYHYHKCSTLRSPSPSRRFGNGEKLDPNSKGLSPSPSVGSYYNPMLFSSRKENLKPSIPKKLNSTRLMRPSLRSSTREQRNVHRISSKIDEIAAAEALACHEIDNFFMEDIDNPLISLDCFIFI